MALFRERSLVGAVIIVLDSYEEHGAVLAALRVRNQGRILWNIDSGATDHVCNDGDAFYSIKACATPTKYKTVGNDVVSEKEGVVAMQLPQSKKLILPHVTYLPSAQANLLSLGTLQQRGRTFDFAQGYIQLGPCQIPMYNVGPKGMQKKGKLHTICLPLVLSSPARAEPPMRSLFVVAQERDTLQGVMNDFSLPIRLPATAIPKRLVKPPARHHHLTMPRTTERSELLSTIRLTYDTLAQHLANQIIQDELAALLADDGDGDDDEEDDDWEDGEREWKDWPGENSDGESDDDEDEEEEEEEEC
ncbi:hypothetical protein QFC21_006342 [Naganishia friedmannii]|uniref:Uncharacterized protein n=1 Tax=Naganishia friedmannii TaxID=89922 RepID=A0ACC2V319_9TREE|nr:hypothetical protein QFC21_006342 [Naganishia friedmannii]